MSYHIGLFDDICLQRWVGFGHWDRGYILLRRFRTGIPFHRQRVQAKAY